MKRLAMKKSDHKAPDMLTLLAQARGVSAHDASPKSASVIPPIEMTTTYLRDASYQLGQSGEYRRDDSANFRQVEAVLSAIENGADALVFSSGMAAAAAVIATLRPGDHIVAPKIGYYGVRRWIEHFCGQFGIGLTLVDPGEPGALERAIIKGKTRLVWIETPTNPTWEVTDIRAAAAAAHAAGARLIVDSTVMTPILCNPLDHGADIVMHSASKYLNGHSDVIAGALVTRAGDDWWGDIRQHRYMSGAILGALETWLLLRGLRTLGLRVERASHNAIAIAEHFEGHTKLSAVLYPGLESHAGHAIAKAQMHNEIGYGGMLSLRLSEGKAAALKLATTTKLFQPATSLGGVESLIEHRATIEGEDSPAPDDLVRLSVGIEKCADLIDDIERALAKIG
jgi:cystathionine gamma-synthase